MPALTKTQLEYIKARAQEAHDSFVQARVAQLGERPEPLDYSENEKRTMIREGVAALKDYDSRSYSRDVTDFFSFPKSAAQVARLEEIDRYHQAATAIASEAALKLHQVLDEVVVGNDGASALAKIDATFAV